MKNSISNPIAMFAISIYLIVPIVLTFVYSISTEWNHVLPQGITFRYYIQILTDQRFLLSLLRTIAMAITPVMICTITVLLAMYAILVYMPRLDKYMQMIATVPYAVQGVILAISVLSIYADAPLPFSNRAFMLVATYSIVILPYIYQGIRNSFFSVNAGSLMEAAQILGASKFNAYFKVVVPNIVTGIIISAMLSSAIIFGDFVVVNIIGGNYFETSQMYLYKAMFQSGQLASAIIVVIFLVTLLLSAGVYYLKNRNRILEEEK
jgi:putative spermidine/putrescine transport system permease protein